MRNIDILYNALIEKFDGNAVIDDLCHMIEIRSENPFEDPPLIGYREQEIGEYFHSRLANLGLEVESRDVVPGRPNVWGRLKGQGGGPALMLAGHLDTVGTQGYDSPFDARVESGRVYGRGACDMKAALAAYLEVTRLIVESDIHLRGDLIVAGIADEEWGMTGAKDVGRNGPWADFGIIGEPSGLAVCPAHKGAYALKIRTFGRAVHSSVPEKGHNAIEDMGRVINQLANHDQNLRSRDPDPICGHGRFSMGVIRGGTMVCTVPDSCELEVDRRTLPGETGEMIREEYRCLLESMPNLEYELSEAITETPPLNVPLNNQVVKATIAAFEVVTGEPARVEALTAGTDAPHLGFPTIIFGPGSCEQAHSLCEYVEIEEVKIATKVYLNTALRMLG